MQMLLLLRLEHKVSMCHLPQVLKWTLGDSCTLLSQSTMHDQQCRSQKLKQRCTRSILPGIVEMTGTQMGTYLLRHHDPELLLLFPMGQTSPG